MALKTIPAVTVVNGWVLPKLEDVLKKVNRENLCPEYTDVYNAFFYVHPESVKVVILGQDPYHSVDQYQNRKANGLAFGIHPEYNGVIDRSSMGNIMRELNTSEAKGFDVSLMNWARQGVLLLNTSLTTVVGRPGAHLKLWQPIIHEVLGQIPTSPVYLCWGAHAKRMAYPHDKSGIVATSHPCSYSALNGKNPFIGSSCFKVVNTMLKRQGINPIDWRGHE